MVSKSAPSATPQVGTVIDNGALELVSVLGYGGYGVVYRAVDLRTPRRPSYAVKCLVHPSGFTPRQRQLHLREITLHRIASAHPAVVSLHRVVEEKGYTFIVMDYCPDGDLFSMILHQRRYLGQDNLIRHVFLQLLDAVIYCHSLGIYHRDLKPENILCYDGGLRIALTDFGLATTSIVSEEFRTGSVYHMSPENQGDVFGSAGSYSPPANDIWSLGIILLNLATGRNPWKSASLSDTTFQAYLNSPNDFIPSVLPISEEVNEILIRALHVDWRKRISLHELRDAVKGVRTFYAVDAIFEDNMARCAWEVGLPIEGAEDVDEIEEDEEADIEEVEDDDEEAAVSVAVQPLSSWSEDSDSEMVFSRPSEDDWSDDEGSQKSGDGWNLDSASPSPRTRSCSPAPVTPPRQRPNIDTTKTAVYGGSDSSLPITPADARASFHDYALELERQSHSHSKASSLHAPRTHSYDMDTEYNDAETTAIDFDSLDAGKMENQSTASSFFFMHKTSTSPTSTASFSSALDYAMESVRNSVVMEDLSDGAPEQELSPWYERTLGEMPAGSATKTALGLNAFDGALTLADMDEYAGTYNCTAPLNLLAPRTRHSTVLHPIPHLPARIPIPTPTSPSTSRPTTPKPPTTLKKKLGTLNFRRFTPEPVTPPRPVDAGFPDATEMDIFRFSPEDNYTLAPPSPPSPTLPYFRSTTPGAYHSAAHGHTHNAAFGSPFRSVVPVPHGRPASPSPIPIPGSPINVLRTAKHWFASGKRHTIPS